MSEKKNKSKKSRVVPTGMDRLEYELESLESDQKNNKKGATLWRNAQDKSDNVLNLITNVKASANRWMHYKNTKRKSSRFSFEIDPTGEQAGRRKTGGDGLGDLADDSYTGGSHSKDTKWQLRAACNRNLIQYFAKMSQSKDSKLDLDFVSSLIDQGASINCTDKYGQTVFHEVARAWHTDIALFLIERGADFNQADNYGRAPLHVAAAVDYPEMVNLLIEKGANKEAKTVGEEQTPVHFAARNDACNSLKALVKQGCEYKFTRDYKGRTPLHLAAELDRSETARLLLELDDPAPAGVEDDSGQAAIVWMITKMGPVAKFALDQFHTTDRANRKQYHHLHRLENKKPGAQFAGCPQSAMHVAVQLKLYDIVSHPILDRLIEIKWRKFGKVGAWITMMINFAFIILWTVIACTKSYDTRHIYNLPGDWWRILISVLAIGLTVYNIGDEIREYYASKKSHNAWKDWRVEEIERDRKYSHPRWPEEDLFLKQEIDELDKVKPKYLNDFWNVFDWIVYAMLFVCVCTHVADTIHHVDMLARAHLNIMAITIILLWLRIMKNARAFSTLGPFIVILGHMVQDLVKFGFLYLIFFIPFSCAFWMIFGGPKVPQAVAGTSAAINATKIQVDGYQNVNELLFSMFRLTVVDDYDYSNMKLVDSVMADMLVAGWLFLSAILCINLFIALLSDTFQRVYDNAQANAVMQKAITILYIEDMIGKKRRELFRDFIHTKCAPEERFYDDDTTVDGGDDLKKVTLQIKDDLDDLRELMDSERVRGQQERDAADDSSSKRQAPRGGLEWPDPRQAPQDGKGDYLNDTFGPQDKPTDSVTVRKFEDEIDILWKEMRDVREKQEDILDQMKGGMASIHSVLMQLQRGQSGGTQLSPDDGNLYQNDGSKTIDSWENLERQRKKEAKKMRRRQQRLTKGFGLLPSPRDVPIDKVPLMPAAEPTIEVSTTYQEVSRPVIPPPPPVVIRPSDIYPGTNPAPSQHSMERSSDTEA